MGSGSFISSHLVGVSFSASRFGHHLTVQRLMFRPNVEDYILASCGDDHIVRVYKINFN